MSDQHGRVQVSGQVAVMMINGLLCKVIFDHNPTNSILRRGKFPARLDVSLRDAVRHHHEDQPPAAAGSCPRTSSSATTNSGRKYSERLIGNWITYDTSVQQIADFVEKIYLRNNYSGFTGDRKFVRDDDAQKAFSKLRSSQAGMYAWRLRLLFPNPPPDPKYLPYRPKSDAEVEQLRKECDFAFKQAFAFCPYSPEAVIRYANFLFQFNRFDDALIVAKTCQKLDPYNAQISGLINQIEDIKKRIGQSPGDGAQPAAQVAAN